MAGAAVAASLSNSLSDNKLTVTPSIRSVIALVLRVMATPLKVKDAADEAVTSVLE